MSHIFDALQRSAAEESGVELPTSTATELLQAAERKAAAAAAAVAVPKPPEREVTIDRESEAGVPTVKVVQAEVKPATEATLATDGIRVDEFRQFQSLKILVPPQSQLPCITEKDSLVAEKFRFLAVRLRHLRQNRPLKKLLVTSTIPGEGKSMVAANLACTLARKAHQKTLLIDGDLRRPSQTQLFGLDRISGLCDWLQGKSDAMGNIYSLEGTELWMLPAGNTPRNPLELMQSGKLPALMNQVTSWFDWIVIDSPPVLPLGDTSVWLRFADGVLLVVREGRTEKQQLKRGLEVVEPTKLIGALVNCTTNTDHTNYYYYGLSPISGGADQAKK